MKKKGDTKELNSDGHRGLNRVLFSCCLIYFFLSISLLAQIDIDGFVVTSKIKIPEGFESFLQVDYNNDKLTDIVIFGKNSKEYLLLQGDKKKLFKQPTERFYFYPVTDLAKLRNRKKIGNVKLFISRSERIAGLAAFTNYGTLQLLTELKLDSYPDKIIAGDFEHDGSVEGLLFGLNFSGIEQINEKKLSLESTKIVKNRIFKSAFPIDLDYDGFDDLVALDLLENGVSIFINNKTGGFYEQRMLNNPLNINDISLADPNNDGFTDIIVYTDNSIDAFRGDSVYSFGESYNVLKNVNSNFLLVENTSIDNNAGLFLYDNNTVSLNYYQKGADSQDYSVYTVLRDSAITRFEKLDGTSKYVAHSKMGWFYVLEKLEKSDKVSFYPGQNYDVINVRGADRNIFLALSDSASSQARMYKLDKDLLPEYLYESNLNYPFKKLNYLFYDQKHLFVLWRSGEKVIEVFTIEEAKEIKREYVYSRLPVTNMNLFYSAINSEVHLLLYGGTNGNILSENITLNARGIEDLPLNFVDSNILALVPDRGEDLTIHTWRAKNDSLEYKIFKPGATNTYSPRQFVGSSNNIEIVGFYELSGSGSLTLMKSKEQIIPLIFRGDGFTSPKIKDAKLLKGKSNYRFFESGNRFIITCDNGKKLYTLRNEGSGLKVSEIKGIELDKINDYFVFSIDRNWYIAYLDNNYLVNIERLNEK